MRWRSCSSRDRPCGGVKTERFLTDILAVIGSPVNYDRQGQIVSAELLAKSRLILREQGSGTRRVVESALRKAGIPVTRDNIFMELDSTEAIKSAVEAGLGIGFVPRRAIRRNSNWRRWSRSTSLA